MAITPEYQKVLAYSTVGQLGYMILAVGTGVCLLLFITYAMFKANLFYGSGSVIHSMHHAFMKNMTMILIHKICLIWVDLEKIA